MDFRSIKDYCFCLTFEELEKIIKNSGIELEDEEDTYEEICELADVWGFTCYDTNNDSIGFNLYELEWRTKLETVNNGVIFALEFDKDTLFQKYEDYNDIYAELYSKLNKYGLKLSMEEIKKHCVLLEGIEYFD